MNANSLSQTEFVIMALKDLPNTTLIGSNTGGANRNTIYMPLPRGYLSSLSSIGIYSMDGECLSKSWNKS